MDPLTALQFAVSPELRAARMPRVGEGFGIRAVPGSELEQLSSSSLAGLAPTPGAPVSFEGTLGKLVGEVNGRHAAASEAVGGLLSGDNVSLHQAMIAMEEASVSFQLMVEVRNKLLESYQELMLMQV
jgi:flagellar hook-basal body complex protein FliE